VDPQSPSPGWVLGTVAAVAGAVTWFFSHFATAKELKEVNLKLSEIQENQKALFSNQEEYRAVIKKNTKVMEDVDGLFRNFQVSKWFKRLQEEAEKEVGK
jgi:type III secretory pathway component EscR